MEYRTEKDSLGEVNVPKNAFYGAQTQRAIENFKISSLILPKIFIRTVIYIKKAAAQTNNKLGLLDDQIARSITDACDYAVDSCYPEHFPVDVFQTGSGTSTNMNVNEVLASLASHKLGSEVHPNDHVNMSQSSNDTIPTAIHVSSILEINSKLLKSLDVLCNSLKSKGEELKSVVKTGRTHLMDATPVTFGQEFSAWLAQIRNCKTIIEEVLPRLYMLTQGGTAVGTGINAHPNFASMFSKQLSANLNLSFIPKNNFFEGLSSQDTIVELSGKLKVLAVSLVKIANDLRIMNSGPLSGIAEIELKALQPGSSIMPGKVNPVIPEAVIMSAAQVIGNDSTITFGGSFGNFQLNVMLPVIAYNILQSIDILSGAANSLASLAIDSLKPNLENINRSLNLNPILVTALNPIIGYQKAAQIAKIAYKESRYIIDVALEQTNLSRSELENLLDPLKLTKGGISENS